MNSNLFLVGDENGFRAGRRGTGNIFILEKVNNCAINRKPGMCISFLDIEKVYDRVGKTILWQVLENLGVCGNRIKTIKSMYRGTKANFILNDIHTD